MPRKKEKIDGIEEKLDYIGLDFDKIPKKLQQFEPLQYRAKKFYNEKQYRQYRYVNVNDIEILLSPTNRLDDIDEKYKKASPLAKYLDAKNEENMLKHMTFLNMLKNVEIEEIKKIEEEQEKLNMEIPFKVKFEGNYLWQIYYSENTDKYFMIVPTEDTEYATFFYILKKQIEDNKNEKVFVPISNVRYSRKYIKASQFEDIENYLWLFTKDWPLVYEVYNKNEELSIQIIGETNVYEKIKTMYKVVLGSETAANEFYKLLKALFILQTELPQFFNFKTNIDKKGFLEFYFDNKKIKYENLIEFIREQYKQGLKRKKEVKSKMKAYRRRLQELQELAASQEIEYLAKEKQISTFLECKKSFFGKFRYYFKYSKKSSGKIKNEKTGIKRSLEVKVEEKEKRREHKKESKKIPIKKVYTLEELIENYKELEELENTMKNLIMDLNAIKLKTKNLAKKIENASKYIEEIDSHKKSIFEFWKYSNKDEMAALPEGEQEEINIIKKIEKVFDYENDLEEFGKKLDKIQRNNLNKNDTDNIFIATTNLIDILNKISVGTIEKDELEESLKVLKKEAKDSKSLNEEEYDIFGNLIMDKTAAKKINNKKHRELPKDKFNVLDINKNTKIVEYKLVLEETVREIFKTLKKGIIPENLPLYKAMEEDKINHKKINVFNLNPEKEIDEAIQNIDSDIILNKINIKEGTRGIGFTNIIFYDDKNKTLPEGMDLSTKMIIDTKKLDLILINKYSFNVVCFENKKDDFSNYEIKHINVYEYDMN